MIRAIAIDDEPLGLEILETYCKEIDFIQLEKTFTQLKEAQWYLQNYPVDLIFLDIHMPSMSGIEFYKQLDQETMVIFTTAHSQYALEGFNLSALDYLLKPYPFDRFHNAVNKAHDYYRFMYKQGDVKEELYLRADYSLVKIALSDILYIEGLADYLKIHLVTGKPIITRMTMKGIMDELPASFLRVHRSYIVPKKRIESIRNKVIYLGGLEIPIGATYKQAVEEAMGK
ncbi:LytTR family DNA-binding domain-containing protein [Echinicola marina]|uniref:LytR/AlgR family response regulator transcription factor n=1 Tax=Echinicola marina TaxID=2859768 RepID=UPI001CF6F02B|nr:LytTR family DNA-binding domain-containing protein [Echinicola marina]UCS92571.1 LytTR family DNA-binding domain-containing protein [Echinicola marina]